MEPDLWTLYWRHVDEVCPIVQEEARAYPIPTEPSKRRWHKRPLPRGDFELPAELEALVNGHPAEVEAWAVISEWWAQRGDPRGELLALAPPQPDPEARARKWALVSVVLDRMLARPTFGGLAGAIHLLARHHSRTNEHFLRFLGANPQLAGALSPEALVFLLVRFVQFPRNEVPAMPDYQDAFADHLMALWDRGVAVPTALKGAPVSRTSGGWRLQAWPNAGRTRASLTEVVSPFDHRLGISSLRQSARRRLEDRPLGPDE